MSVKISVVLPVWIVNDELYSLTDRALYSIVGSYGFKNKCELIIVDNASPLGGDQLMANCDLYIRNKINLGYPAAVNQGLKLAGGELVCIANNDIRVSPNWIGVAEETFKRLNGVGSLHFKMVGYDEPFNCGDAVWDKGRERWCTGSFFVWNREAIEQAGRMDENYGLGGYDDYDWQYRMRHLAGWKTVYTNAAAYQHKDSTSQNLRIPTERKGSDLKNYEYFKKKYGEYPDRMWEAFFPKQFRNSWRPFP